MIQHNKHSVCAIPLYEDNYAWLIYDETSAWIIDPGKAAPINDKARNLGVTLKAMLITHGHWDHVNGINDLAALYAPQKLPVYGSANIHAGINQIVSDGTKLDLNGLMLEVWHTPGHMAEHLSFYCREANWLFCGDTLFSAGCGRLKQTGNMRQLFHSLARIKKLPPQTQLFCSHEYTLSNLAFAQTVEPNNKDIAHQINAVKQLRQNNQPSIPSTLATELACNPFLRIQEPVVITAVNEAMKNAVQHTYEAIKANKENSEPFAIFTALREWKDRF